jgi:hypothetical protein
MYFKKVYSIPFNIHFCLNRIIIIDLPCCKSGLWKGNDVETDWENNFPPVWKPKNYKDPIYGGDD